MEHLAAILASILGFLVASRLAYGCWAWEWRKTWYNTRDSS